MNRVKGMNLSGEVDGRCWSATYRPGDVTGASVMGVPPSWTVRIDGIDGGCYGPNDIPAEDSPGTRERLESFVREQIAQSEGAK